MIIALLLILGCNSQTTVVEKQNWEETVQNSSTTQKKDPVRYHTAKDTQLIATEIGDTLRFSKKEFNRIVDEHPEFYTGFTYDPDQLYHRYGTDVDFGSEVGQDAYFVLYAYFLKQQTENRRFAEQRKRLIEIYSRLNDLFAHFQYGGTYFGHQRVRILGYAEYAVYLYSKERENFEKSYDITRQKELYIRSLEQLVVDECSIEGGTMGTKMIERKKKLLKLVGELDSLISHLFYLRSAQAFQFDHYTYY